MKKCIFFDRDGIVNRPPDPERYVTSLHKFHLEEAWLDALKVVNGKGYEAIIVTNQRCLFTGDITLEELGKIHGYIFDQVHARGLRLLDIFVSPFSGEHQSAWRKPEPGMLLHAAKVHDLDLSHSWMIGDSPSDIEAGHAAGCHTLLVGKKIAPDFTHQVLSSMEELPALLQEQL